MPLTHSIRAATRHLSCHHHSHIRPSYNYKHVTKHLHMSLRHQAACLHTYRSLPILVRRSTAPALLLKSTHILAPRTTMSSTQTQTQTRSHAGHSHGHGHGHNHDNTYLTSSNRNDAGVKITRVGLFVNLGMAIGKGVGGYVFHSQALIADGFHALTDLVSDFMTLATISWSLKPATDRFPSGFGKIEGLGALGVSGLLLFGGMGIGLNALDALYTQFFIETAAHAHEHAEHSHGLFSFLGHSHSHGGHTVPNLNAAWLAGGSIIVKEWLYRASEYRPSNWLQDRMLTSGNLSYENCPRT